MPCGEKVTQVVAALIEIDNKLLICQRPKEKKQGGFWEFPGGKVELGEALELALKREITEELDLAITNLKFIGWADHVYEEEEGTINLLGFVAQLQQADEHQKLLTRTDCQILKSSEIDPEKLTPPDRYLLELYIKSKDQAN